MKFLMSSAIALSITVAGFGQVSSDSVSSLKQQKQSLELSSKINANKIQLAKLENNLEKKTHEMETTSEDARKAADENAEAAAKLSSDPLDKALARRAENAGDAARKSAKRARAAVDNLADLKKNIELLRSKIADDEAKLVQNPVVPPPHNN
jgi:homoserine dehydrogenase